MVPTAPAAPDPDHEGATICVVETGAPSKVAGRITAVEALWLEKPSIGDRRKIRRPIVRMIRQPPSAVPIVSAAPQTSFTQSGTVSVSRWPLASSSAAITPIDFWASLAPWPNASAADIPHCARLIGSSARGSPVAGRAVDAREGEAEAEPEERRDRERDQHPVEADRVQPIEPAEVDGADPGIGNCGADEAADQRMG